MKAGGGKLEGGKRRGPTIIYLLKAAAVTAIAGVVHLVLAAASMYVSDDTFIAFRYARNGAETGLFTWNPGYEMVDGFTSFLHVCLLTAGYLREIPMLTLQSYSSIVFVFAILGLFCALCYTLKQVNAAGMVAGAVLLALYRPMAWFVTAGFETLLYTTIFLLAVLLFVMVLQGRRNLLWPLWLILFVFLLVRPEAIALSGLMAGIVLLKMLWAGERRIAVIGYGLCLLLPLLVYLYIRTEIYGYPVPNTYFAKNAGGKVGRFLNGLDYARSTLLWGGGTMFVAALAGLYWFRRNLPLLSLCILTICYGVIIIISGGDNHPGFRFLVPVLPLLVVVALALLAVRSLVARGISATVLSILLLSQLTGPVEDKSQHFQFKPNGTALLDRIREGWKNIEDNRWPITASNFNSGRKILAESFNDIFPIETTLAAADVGQIGFYMHQPIIDMYGLNDKKIAHLPAKDWGRWHTYGKLVPLVGLHRNLDVTIENVSVDAPQLNWDDPSIHQDLRSSAFRAVFEPVNIAALDADGYIHAYVNRNSPVIDRAKTEYWSIAAFITDLYVEKPTVYKAAAPFHTLFDMQLERIATVTTTAEAMADFYIVPRENEELHTRLRADADIQIVPQLMFYRNDWHACYLRKSAIRRNFDATERGQHYMFIPLPELEETRFAEALVELDGSTVPLHLASLALPGTGTAIRPVLVLPGSGLAGELKVRATDYLATATVEGVYPRVGPGNAVYGSSFKIINTACYYPRHLALYGAGATASLAFELSDVMTEPLTVRLDCTTNDGQGQAQVRVSANGTSHTISVEADEWHEVDVPLYRGRNEIKVDVLSSGEGTVWLKEVHFGRSPRRLF